ncbi:hypothetical protein [Thermosulfurimonas sp. F29]|uniref:hypothetical protein n=1 Tax=Thermosulfurimonas sp. F29 TaxID=2867247 RepID=UPI001C8354BF|nr:hypothetical protein [Thermosulfurimonas sp. F29]MBX6422191.1 hypothetical protein [Thermosulfurimonas sp. F29]
MVPAVPITRIRKKIYIYTFSILSSSFYETLSSRKKITRAKRKQEMIPNTDHIMSLPERCPLAKGEITRVPVTRRATWKNHLASSSKNLFISEVPCKV